jgi:hypothetical protein
MNVLYVIIFTLIGCNNQKSETVKKIKLTKVDFAITSIISVDCDRLENYFNEEVETIIIEDQNEIEKIMKVISSLESDTTNYKPDVRAKLLLHYDNNKIDTICMSDIGILYNGKSYNINKDLVKIVEDAPI